MYIVRRSLSLGKEVFPFTITWPNLKVTGSGKYTSNERIYTVWPHLYDVLTIVQFPHRESGMMMADG